MRVQLLTLFALAGLPVGFAAADEQPDVWQPAYEDAASEAGATGRPILIHFYAEWCGPCRQMEARVLNQPSVLESLHERVAAVKVNYDERADLVNRFGVGALPCDLLVGTQGEVLMRTTGYVAATTYVERIARLAPVVASPHVAPLSPNVRDLGAARHVGSMLLADDRGWSSVPAPGLRTVFETR